MAGKYPGGPYIIYYPRCARLLHTNKINVTVEWLDVKSKVGVSEDKGRD